MVKIILLFESTCSKCGAKAKYCCSNCGQPLCGRCLSREKKELISNIIIPAGLCSKCVELRIDSYKKGEMNPLSEAVSIYVTEPITKEKVVNNSNS
ncbi:MAG: hypothetical protein KAS47_07015 [Candidatus Heimdallarchaeota archaeon]|nr:hypothetical protein [Candidatus Heimdallarchaeota archaeon]